MTTTALPQSMQAVQFDDYGEEDVLEVRDVPLPAVEAGHVLVRVRATSVNPGEASIRRGVFAEQWPSDFPSGEGSDVAGEVAVAAEGFAVGDRVFGWTDDRAAHAQYAAVPATQLVRTPDGVTDEQAGSLHVAGATAVAAVRALDLEAGDTVVISAAAGGVGVLATQLAVQTGATVIGLAGEANHPWLREHGAIPVQYGEGQLERIREAAPDGVDAFLDLFGGGYVALALDELGVAVDRVNTIIDFPAVQERGVQAQGNSAGADIANLVGLADQLAAGTLELPIQRTFPLTEVRAAYTELAARHTHGKLVLLP